MRNLKSGMILPEVCIVIGIFAAAISIATPSFMKMAERTKAQKCINNLRQIQIAKEQWALNKNKSYTAIPGEDDINGYIRAGVYTLWCPLDPGKLLNTSYDINNIGIHPVCKFDGEKHVLVGGGFVTE